MHPATRPAAMRLLTPLVSGLLLLSACHADRLVGPGASRSTESTRHAARNAGVNGENNGQNDDNNLANDNYHGNDPGYNLDIVLRAVDPGNGTGHIAFRQPVDADVIALLDVTVTGLAPNTHYRLQRATDTSLDGICTGTNWLTLGKGAVAEDIITDDHGKGSADLFRVLAAFLGSTFDIHFRVIDATTADVVLESRCHQFTVRS